MAKAPKSKGRKPSSHLTIPPPTGAKSVTMTGSCCNCGESASWVLKTCEDGECVDIPPPTFFAVLCYDPDKSPQTGPYWGKPANFPVNELRDLLTNMISSMTPTQVMNLWSQLISGMSNTEKSGLAAALVGKLQCSPPPPATGSCTMTSI